MSAASLLGRDGHLLLAGFLGEIVDHGDDLLDRGVRGVERGDDLLLGHFLRAGLDHHQAVLAADDDQIELALFALLERRVDDVLAVDQAHAHGGDRLLERDVGERQRDRGAGDRQHVGVVFLVGGQHERDDLRLVAPAGREQRPRRAVDHPAGQHFLFGRLAFALEEAARDAPRRRRCIRGSRRSAGGSRSLPAGLAEWHAVTSTTESPRRTMTEPCACLASLPVSKRRVFCPTEISRVCIGAF